MNPDQINPSSRSQNDSVTEKLYRSLHDISAHYDDLVSRFVEEKSQPAYRALYDEALEALNCYEKDKESTDPNQKSLIIRCLKTPASEFLASSFKNR
jgi:hypothetical protein